MSKPNPEKDNNGKEGIMPEYEKCIKCGNDLLEEHIDLDVDMVYGILFCNNAECPRYLLHTQAAPQPKLKGGES